MLLLVLLIDCFLLLLLIDTDPVDAVVVDFEWDLLFEWDAAVTAAEDAAAAVVESIFCCLGGGDFSTNDKDLLSELDLLLDEDADEAAVAAITVGAVGAAAIGFGNEDNTDCDCD